MIHQVLLIHYVLIDEPFPLRHIFGMLPIVPIFGWQQDAKLWRDVDEQQLPIHSLFLSAKTPPAIFADAAMLPPTRPSMALLESCTYFKSESFALPLSLSLSTSTKIQSATTEGRSLIWMMSISFPLVIHWRIVGIGQMRPSLSSSSSSSSLPIASFYRNCRGSMVTGICCGHGHGELKTDQVGKQSRHLCR